MTSSRIKGKIWSGKGEILCCSKTQRRWKKWKIVHVKLIYQEKVLKSEIFNLWILFCILGKFRNYFFFKYVIFGQNLKIVSGRGSADELYGVTWHIEKKKSFYEFFKCGYFFVNTFCWNIFMEIFVAFVCGHFLGDLFVGTFVY